MSNIVVGNGFSSVVNISETRGRKNVDELGLCGLEVDGYVFVAGGDLKKMKAAAATGVRRYRVPTGGKRENKHGEMVDEMTFTRRFSAVECEIDGVAGVAIYRKC